MRNVLCVLTILVMSTNLLAFDPFMGPGKVGKSDSGIDYPKYSEIVDQIKKVVANYPKFATLINIGKTVKGLDTWGVLIKDGEAKPDKLIYVSGATHGNEYLHIADQLVGKFLDPANKEFYEFYGKGGAIMVIPIFNPDGYVKRTRYNSKRVDLNRDFTNVMTEVVRFKQPETQNIRNWMDTYLEKNEATLLAAMDYHCCYKGALLFPWGYTKKLIPSNDYNDHVEIGKIMQNYFPKGKYGAVSEMLWYLADGASLDYWYAKYDALALTYEGRHKTEYKSIDKHVSWWKEIIDLF